LNEMCTTTAALFKFILFYWFIGSAVFAFSPSSSSSSQLMSATQLSEATVSDNDAQTNNVESGGTTKNNGVKLGFIGCGTIASAIATGLLTQNKISISSVVVSRRSESKSKLLNEKYGDELVKISDDNQFIVDNSDIIFLCVLPQQEEEVLTNLQIDEEKTLVSLVSTSKLETLIRNSKLPAEKVYKMICLPAVALLEGTPLLVPKSKSDLLRDLLSTLGSGTCIECENEDIMESMMVPGCMMGPVYGLMKKNRDFLVSKGVPAKDATVMVGRQYWAMVKDAVDRCDNVNSLDELIDEQTPGGLNEQSLKNLESIGFMESYEDAMEAVLGRIKGETDGTMKPKSSC